MDLLRNVLLAVRNFILITVINYKEIKFHFLPCPLAQIGRKAYNKKLSVLSQISQSHEVDFFKKEKKTLNVVIKKKSGLVWSYLANAITVSLEIWQERACGDWGNLAGYVHSKHGINLDLNSWLINQLQKYLLHLTDGAMIFHPNKRKSVPLTKTNSQEKKMFPHCSQSLGTLSLHWAFPVSLHWGTCTHVKSFCHTGEKRQKAFKTKETEGFWLPVTDTKRKKIPT